jgi:hypothetical protein
VAYDYTRSSSSIHRLAPSALLYRSFQSFLDKKDCEFSPWRPPLHIILETREFTEWHPTYQPSIGHFQSIYVLPIPIQMNGMSDSQKDKPYLIPIWKTPKDFESTVRSPSPRGNWHSHIVAISRTEVPDASQFIRIGQAPWSSALRATRPQ